MVLSPVGTTKWNVAVACFLGENNRRILAIRVHHHQEEFILLLSVSRIPLPNVGDLLSVGRPAIAAYQGSVRLPRNTSPLATFHIDENKVCEKNLVFPRQIQTQYGLAVRR